MINQTKNMLIRPVAMEDLDNLYAVTQQAGVGLTTLSIDKEVLANRIERSLHSFSHDIKRRGDEEYLFVLEDTQTGAIAGCCAIIATVGFSQPAYAYKLGTVVQVCSALGIKKNHEVLHLVNDYQGSSELASLLLSPDYRQHGLGELLARSRLLFIAEFPKRFSDTMMAELRGVSDESGYSPFWKGLGRHFFSMDFTEVDYLNAIGKRFFVSDLMPKYPIYVSLLPKAAQEVVGKVHEDTRPALAMLEKEHFILSGYVDIFDGGPAVEAKRDKIRTVKKSQTGEVAAILPALEAPTHLISNVVLDFRVCSGPLRVLPDETLEIAASVAKALQVKKGDRLRFVPAGKKS